jgi:hypothetical protein
MEINAPNDQPGQPQLYKWYATGDRVTWPQLLRLWGSEIASKQAGDAGTYICDQLLGLADLAETWRVEGPAAMTARKQAEAEQEACYLAALEHDAAWDPGPEPDYEPNDDFTGSLSGHPSQEEGARQVWLACDSDDDTYAN